jgi:hypothetical protein
MFARREANYECVASPTTTEAGVIFTDLLALAN